jgi:hypothetical protein
MKKLLAILLTVILCISIFAGCGNMSLGLGNYEFTKIHIDTHHFSGCVKVEKWYENTTGVEVKTPQGNCYFSEGTYFMVEDECPICDQY